MDKGRFLIETHWVNSIDRNDEGRLQFMGIAPQISRLRQFVGHELLVLAGTAVLPRDDYGKILLVQNRRHRTVGGNRRRTRASSPQQAVLRKAEEEPS